MAPRIQWRTDPTTGQRVRGSNSSNAWVNDRDRIVTPQRSLQDAAAGTTAPQRSSDAALSQPMDIPQSTAPGGPSRTADPMGSLPRSFQQMNISPRSSSSNVFGTTPRTTTDTALAPAPGPLPAPDSGSNTATGTDPQTGVETLWEVRALTRFTDPGGQMQRSVNLKHIREVNGKRASNVIKGYERPKDRKSPEKEYTGGRVVEVLLVPPTQTGSSTISRITPNGNFTNGLLRLRRFVIVRERPEGRNSFQALAIKTYNGLGVGALGVIKSHHAIIFTGKPMQGQNELPKSMPNGQMEDGMQPQPLQVIQYDKTKALDPMARLDFCDVYEFDYGVKNMKFFGKVHSDSLSFLDIQYKNVWAAVMRAAKGIGAAAAPTGTIAGGTTGTSAIAGPSSATGPSGENPSSTSSGSITDDQMRAQLQKFQRHAREHGLTVPGLAVTQDQIHRLAMNAEARAKFFQQIKARWASEEEEEEEEEDSESDD